MVIIVLLRRQDIYIHKLKESAIGKSLNFGFEKPDF